MPGSPRRRWPTSLPPGCCAPCWPRTLQPRGRSLPCRHACPRPQSPSLREPPPARAVRHALPGRWSAPLRSLPRPTAFGAPTAPHLPLRADDPGGWAPAYADRGGVERIARTECPPSWLYLQNKSFMPQGHYCAALKGRTWAEPSRYDHTSLLWYANSGVGIVRPRCRGHVKSGNTYPSFANTRSTFVDVAER